MAMHAVEHDLKEEDLLSETDDDSDEVLVRPFDPQDMRTMGGLSRYLPATGLTYLIATLAIAGLPPLAGFFPRTKSSSGYSSMGTTAMRMPGLSGDRDRYGISDGVLHDAVVYAHV